jgi:cation transport ATPase
MHPADGANRQVHRADRHLIQCSGGQAAPKHSALAGTINGHGVARVVARGLAETVLKRIVQLTAKAHSGARPSAQLFRSRRCFLSVLR